MRIYDRLKDDYGNPITGRTNVFIPHDELEADGSVGGYTAGGIVPNKRGYTFIIEEDDVEFLSKCKIMNGQLTRK